MRRRLGQQGGRRDGDKDAETTVAARRTVGEMETTGAETTGAVRRRQRGMAAIKH
ncbi:MAG: hypothetical protein J1E40_01045 [Oscillospiraceae bacterium]|nr:hypothetical protein [Oscillospiraceae bacterium]